MLIQLTHDQTTTTLGAMRQVASANGAKSLTPDDQRALEAFDTIVLRQPPIDIHTLPQTTPAQLAAALAGTSADAATHVAQFLIVMALVDGTVDESKIQAVLDYAHALGVTDDSVRQLAELGRGNLAWVRADAQRQNMLSITGHEVNVVEDDWILPYRGDHADPALVARFRALGGLAAGTFGRTFFEFYQDNGFPFSGQPEAFNAQFTVPHDSTHVLSGYNTSPQGELLVSTFTAGMHPQEPMSGHILPVIISWHLGIELVKAAGKITGQLDPVKFWMAWDRGSEVTTDLFAPGWDFWDAAGKLLEALRAEYHVPPLDPAYTASGKLPAWYRPVA